jgi:hypothetical protein
MMDFHGDLNPRKCINSAFKCIMEMYQDIFGQFSTSLLPYKMKMFRKRYLNLLTIEKSPDSQKKYNIGNHIINKYLINVAILLMKLV